MRLIHHKNDIVALVERRVDLIEQENGGDNNLSDVTGQLVAEIVLVFRNNEIGHVCCAERSEDLIFKVYAVKNDKNGRIVEFLRHTELLSCKDHKERLSASLEVPNQALLGLSALHTLNHKVGALILLVTTDNLEFSELFIGRENREIAEDIKNGFVLDHSHQASLNVGKSAFVLAFRNVPRTPMGNTCAHSTVTETLALGSKIKDVRYKHTGDTLLVVKDILCAVNPRNSFAGCSLDFADNNRETVDQKHDIKTLAALNLRINPLIGNNVAILCHLLRGTHTEICNRNKAMVLSKRKRILLEDLILEFFVDGNKISSFRLHKERS